MSALTAIKEKMPSIPWSKMGKFPALWRREFLDNKFSLFNLPVIVSVFTLGVMILGLISMEIQMGDDVIVDLNQATITIDGEVIQDDEFVGDGEKSRIIDVFSKVFTGGTAVGLFMILPFIVFFGLLSSLYDDRKDRSFLFWKSMPVSDTTEVLSKFSFLTIGGPFILFFFMFLLSLASMIVITPFILAHGGNPIEFLWAPAPWISMWVATAANYVVYALWVLPLMAWLMLASAYAPKAPMVFAILPIAAIIAVESIFNTSHTTVLGQVLLDRIALDYAHIMKPIFERKEMFEGDFEVHILTIGDAFRALGSTLANFKFWVGQLFTGAFLAAAIYLRRYKV